MKKKSAYRQGDVALFVVDAIPAGVRTAREDHILAHGEVTGHAHRITEGECELLDVVDERGALSTYLSVGDGGALLTHEEHGKHALAKGTYRIMIQREYEPSGWTQVVD